MSNEDYALRGAGDLTPRAMLQTAVTQGTTRFFINNYSMIGGNFVGVGSAVMIDEEICKITAYDDGWLDLDRGCADTIPAAHAVGAMLWFFDNATGTDQVEYVAGETLSVKLLPTTTSTRMVVSNSPPNQITFQGRAGRPYPPGKLQVNGNPFYTPFALALGPSLNLTWAHRNRIIQADVLVGHQADSITPEEGTTYNVRIYNASNAMVREFTGITDAGLTYTRAQMITDFAVGSGLTVPGYAIIESQRGAFKSLQTYRVDFTFQSSAPTGLGFRLGQALGV